MFWRRSRAKEQEATAEETDDLVKLQKQFGITPVNDADVQAEFQALIAATGATGGSSPTEESLLFGAGDDDEDEEAKILRDLELDGFNLDDDEEEEGSDGHQQAKSELRGVLNEVHQTAKENHSREAAEMRGETPKVRAAQTDKETNRAAQVHALKVEALALKREGKIQEALAKFREAKQLQEQYSAQTADSRGTVDNSSLDVKAQERSGRHAMETVMGEGDHDVEVTDEDMQDPEFLAQLAKMGLTEEDKGDGNTDVVQQLSVLETQIRDCKMQAVQLKRQNQIADALACMRKMKELEAKRDELRSAPVATPSTAVRETATLEVKETIFHSVPVGTPASVPLNLGAVPLETQPDSDSDNMSDVEVSPEDMDDPEFAAELLKLGGGGSSSTDPTPTNALIEPRRVPDPPTAVPKPTVPSSRSLKNAPSIDEDYLIDAFDDKSDSEEETNHLTSVMSSGSLHSISSLPEADKLKSPGENVSVKATADIYHIAELTAQVQKARQAALAFKRKGDIERALESMRRAKQIQNLIDLKQQASRSPAMGSVQDSNRAAEFQEIEELLVDFGNRAMNQAKEQLSSNREKASEWLNKRKHYGAELEKLRQMRQNPVQLPPQYEIVKASREVEFELPFVPDDQIKVSVKSVNGLSQVAGKSVFVKFCLNFPSATPHEGQTDEFQIISNGSLSTEIPSTQTKFVFRLARSRGTMRLFEIKKAIFEVWKPGTLFRNPELVARAYQELTPLLTCCEINTHIPFLGSNRKPCGGDIEIAIQLRRPLKQKETRAEIVEELVIGDYPTPVEPSSEHVSMPSVELESPPSGTCSPSTKEEASISDNISTEGKEDPSPSMAASLDDPHHVDLIVSYDVINEELEKVEAKLSSLSGPIAIEWSDRYDSLALKKQLLEIDMQTGKLTLDMYVERLKTRISADRALISQLLTSNRRLDAARVLHRVKIMKIELVGTEGDSAES